MYLKIEYLFISFAVHACWRTLSLTVGAGSYNRILFNDFLKVAKSGYSALDHTMHQSFLPFSLASVVKRLVVSCSTYLLNVSQMAEPKMAFPEVKTINNKKFTCITYL